MEFDSSSTYTATYEFDSAALAELAEAGGARLMAWEVRSTCHPGALLELEQMPSVLLFELQIVLQAPGSCCA